MKLQIFYLLEQYIKQCPPNIKGSEPIRNFVEKLRVELMDELDQSQNAELIHVSDAIEAIITSSRGDKKGLVEFVRGFCDFNERRGGVRIELKVLKAEIIDDPTERRLRIVCFLHEAKETCQIMEHFYLNERTVRSDIKELQEGISFMGTEIKVDAVREKKKVRYVSTVHPILLPLNLTEVYALTVGTLKYIPEDNPMHEIYRYLAHFTYGQLSDYGKKIIGRAAEESRVGG